VGQPPLPGSTGGVEVVLVPAQHGSSRSLNDRLAMRWGGFAVFAGDCHPLYAGDTGYSRDFTDIRARFRGRQGSQQGGGFDIALLPIGAYGPRWFMAELGLRRSRWLGCGAVWRSGLWIWVQGCLRPGTGMGVCSGVGGWVEPRIFRWPIAHVLLQEERAMR
jgi:hypothetical protein